MSFPLDVPTIAQYTRISIITRLKIITIIIRTNYCRKSYRKIWTIPGFDSIFSETKGFFIFIFNIRDIIVFVEFLRLFTYTVIKCHTSKRLSLREYTHFRERRHVRPFSWKREKRKKILPRNLLEYDNPIIDYRELLTNTLSWRFPTKFHETDRRQLIRHVKFLNPTRCVAV